MIKYNYILPVLVLFSSIIFFIYGFNNNLVLTECNINNDSQFINNTFINSPGAVIFNSSCSSTLNRTNIMFIGISLGLSIISISWIINLIISKLKVKK